MCDFCSRKMPKDWGRITSEKAFENESLASSLDAIIKDGILILDYDAYSCDSSFNEEIKINFCPMCGKKL